MNVQNWPIRRKLLAAFVLLLFIQIGVAAVTYNGINLSDTNTGWVTHTYEVTNGLKALLGDLKDAETGQRGYLITGEDSYLEPYTAALAMIDVDFDTVRTLTADNANQQARLDALEPLIAVKMAELKQTIDLRRSSGFDAAQAVVLTDAGNDTMNQIRTMIADAQQEEQDLMAARNASARSSSQTVVWSLVVGALIAGIITITLATALTRSISKPLRELSLIAEQITNGDLSARIPENQRGDEIGVLAQAFRRMVEVLRRSTGNISQAISLLGSSANEILASTTQVAAGTAQTAASINETTTTVEEVRQAAELSAQKAQYVSDNANRVAQISQSGQRAVLETSTGMQLIRDQMGIIAQTVVRLSEQSQSIGGIIASVTDLADQSNLLAVNAAIEAAKAGEQGRGFAVVAQEIKSLAEQSKQATTQVRGILSHVQRATGNAVMATEQGSKAVEAGVKQAGQAGEAIRLLAESSDEAVQAAIQIVASSQQQVVGMQQIGVAMVNINQAGAQTAVSMKQMEGSAQDLQQLGEQLETLVKQFKV